MMQTLACQDFGSRGFIERYLARTLSPEDQEAFEAHYLTCARCQEALTLGLSIRALLPRTRARPPVRWLAWGGLAGLAAAAGLAAVLLLPSQGSDALRGLGAVRQAPIYLGVPVRGGGSRARADSLFEAAMADYVAEQYGRAATGLSRALRAGVDSAPAEFFRAASLLMDGNARDAADGFARTVALGDTPYRGEAHFYRAKALLQSGRSGEALGELTEAANAGGVIGGYARSLADSIRELQRR